MVAQITYVIKQPDIMIVDHTEVDEELQGQDIGLQLVESVVAHARAKDKQIVPVCTFAKAMIERKKEYRDVLR